MKAEAAQEFRAVRYRHGADLGLDRRRDDHRLRAFRLCPREDAVQQINGPVLPGTSVVCDQRTQMLVVRDGYGRDLVQVGLARSDRQFFPVPPVTTARLNGHLMLLQTNSEVVAISTLRTSRRSGDAILWREDLAQLSDNDFNNGRQNFQQRGKSMPWGQMRQFLTDASNRPIGVLGPVTRHGVVFQRLRELACVDPLSGETLWTRSDVEPGVELFGDDELIFIVPPNKTEAVVVSALDGRELGRREVGHNDTRWTTLGRLVLAWKGGNQQTTVRLFDAWTGIDVLTRQVANETKGHLIGTDEFALLQPDGQFAIHALRDGQPRVQANVGEVPKLNWIRVLRSQDQYLLLADRSVEKRDNKFTLQPLQATLATTVARAHLHAFDRHTGRAQWPVPAVVEDFSLFHDQPAEVPALTFFRQYQKQNRPSGQQLAILCLDKRDGRVLFEKDELVSPQQVFDITADQENKRLTISTPVKSFTLTFTDAPVAPEPPAQLGYEASVSATTSEDVVKELNKGKEFIKGLFSK